MKEPTILRVGNETIPAKFAGSIFHILMGDEEAKVKARAMGSTASHRMFKGVVKAQAYFDQVGLKLFNQLDIEYETIERIEKYTKLEKGQRLNEEGEVEDYFIPVEDTRLVQEDIAVYTVELFVQSK